MNENNLTIIIDNVGRTIVGKKKNLDQNSLDLVLENPAVIYVTPDEENKGRISVQMMPLFFREFLADKESPVLAHYKSTQYVLLEIANYDERMNNQYQQTFGRIIIPESPQISNAKEPKVVDLFDLKTDGNGCARN